MYRIPDDLDLSPVVGQCTTQVLVGSFDLQFTFGSVHFAVRSPIHIFREGKPYANWSEGRWLDAGFYDILNSTVLRCEIVNDRLIVFEFDGSVFMHLEDSFDQYESMEIYIEGAQGLWII